MAELLKEDIGITSTKIAGALSGAFNASAGEITTIFKTKLDEAATTVAKALENVYSESASAVTGLLTAAGFTNHAVEQVLTKVFHLTTSEIESTLQKFWTTTVIGTLGGAFSTVGSFFTTTVGEILRSGFPGIRDLPERARQVQLDSYVARIVERELPENGIDVRRPVALRAWLVAYAAATATNATYSAILDAATPGEGDKPARQTAGAYREHLRRLFVLDPLDAWTPAFAPLKRLTHTPKHHLVDPAVAARLVGVDKTDLLRGKGDRVSTGAGTWLGALFESLVAQSVRVYASAAAASIGHLRTKNGSHEVDLVVEAGDRSCVAIEVKLSNTVDDQDVAHLGWLQQQIGARLADRLVVCTGRFAYRRPDGVAVVPLALLGP